jgi:hypothetical protein
MSTETTDESRHWQQVGGTKTLCVAASGDRLGPRLTVAPM